MANITPYDPGALPNRVVGTPGVDQSAGAAEAALGAGTTEVRNAEAKLATQAASTVGQAVGLVSRFAGDVIIDVRAAKAKQQQQIADANQAKDAHKFASSANDTLNEYKTKYGDTPGDMPSAMSDWLKKAKETELRKYDKDPVGRAKADADYEKTITTINNQAGDWALGRQVDNMKLMASGMVEQARDAVREQTGSINERLQNFDNQNQIMAKGLGGMQPLLGKLKHDEAVRVGLQETSSELVGNLVNERPRDPVEALQHLDTTKRILQGSVSMGLQLKESDKHKYAGQIEAAERYELKELEHIETANQAEFNGAVGVRRVELDLQHENPELQQQALDWAKSAATTLKGRISEIQADASLTPDAKAVLQKSAMEQMKTVDQIARIAHANQQYQLSLKKAAEAEKRREAAEARRIKHEAERDLKAARQREKEAAKAELKMNELESKKALYDKLEAFEKLAIEPTKNRDKLVQLQSEISFLAHNSREAGYIKPEEAHSFASKVNRIGLASANYKERAQFGVFGAPQTVKIKDKNADEKIKARAAYEAEVQKAAAELKAARQAEARLEVAQLSPEGQAEYRKWMAQVEASNQPEEKKALSRSAIFAKIRADYPAKAQK